MKHYILVAVLCFGAINLLAQPDNSTPKSENSSAGNSKAAATQEHNGIAAANGEEPKGSPEKWYTAFEKPDWWILLIAAITGFVIAYQAREMKRATEVMREQTRSSINTERAWVLVEIGEIPDFQPNPNQVEILWIRPTLRNYGNTVARIKRIRAVVRLVPDGETLPPRPEYPLGQGADIQGINLLLPPSTPIQPIKLGVSGDEFARVRMAAIFLYLHGFIEYLDLSDKVRRTAFCFYYVLQRGYSPDPTRFYLELTAPPEYNECA